MRTYREHRPHPALHGRVDCLWSRQATITDDAVANTIVPDGCADLIWLDGALKVVGPDTGPRTVPVPHRGLAVGIRLAPGAAGLLLGSIPTSELRDQQIPLTELWGRPGEVLHERMADAAGRVPEILRMLEREALRRLPEHQHDPSVAAAVAALACRTPVSIPALADDLGLSERQLRRRFISTVGYGPKTLHGVLRFQLAQRLGKTHSKLADLAQLAGYADQAHLTREFRRLCGRTPAAQLHRTQVD